MGKKYEIEWTSQGWEDFEFWATANKKMARRIVDLLDSIKENPFAGIGKPEALKYSLSGCWSRRIDAGNRLVYEVRGEIVYILHARSHYGK